MLIGTTVAASVSAVGARPSLFRLAENAFRFVDSVPIRNFLFPNCKYYLQLGDGEAFDWSQEEVGCIGSYVTGDTLG